MIGMSHSVLVLSIAYCEKSDKGRESLKRKFLGLRDNGEKWGGFTG